MRFSDSGSGTGAKVIPHSPYSAIRKRSIVLDGQRTSISLEDPFWRALRAIAHDARVNTSTLVAQINAKRGEIGLSSAVRQFVFCHYVNDQTLSKSGAEASVAEA
jgi:predicted DNA-binding ribbon-helix-helix protein